MLAYSFYPRDNRVRREAEALVEAGFMVDVICLKLPPKAGRSQEVSRDRIKGVEVHRFPISRKRASSIRYIFEYLSMLIGGAWKLAIIHLRKPFHAVHIHNMPDALVLAGLFPKWTGAKLILDVHDPMLELYINDGEYNRIFTKAIKWQERWSYRLADRIITVNECMVENIRKKGVQSNRVFVVHNFPDIQSLPISDHIERWQRLNDRMVWLYAGTIGRQYRLDIAIKALKIASSYLPPITLRLLGPGQDLKRVLDLSESLGVRGNIERLESVDHEQVMSMMKNADIGISCAQGGPFGDLLFSQKIVDYLSQGLPVVCSRTKALVRYIPEDMVFFFESENAEDMAKQIIFLWNHPDVVKQKLENAKKLFPRYTWQHEKSNLIQFYHGFLQ